MSYFCCSQSSFGDVDTLLEKIVVAHTEDVHKPQQKLMDLLLLRND